MKMFYAAWLDGRPGFVCVAAGLAEARAAALEEGGGDEPLGVVALPPTFGARVHFGDDKDDAEAETIEVEVMDHVIDALGAADDAIRSAAPVVEVEPTIPVTLTGLCDAVATHPTTGATVRCTRPAGGHSAGEHRGEGVGW